MSAANPEQEIDDALHVDQHAWDRQTLLEYFVDIYENPADAHNMNHHEFVSWISEWSNLLDAEQEQERFQQLLEDLDDQYISSWWTDENNGEVIFYGAVKDPDNDEKYIIRDTDENDDYTAAGSNHF